MSKSTLLKQEGSRYKHIKISSYPSNSKPKTKGSSNQKFLCFVIALVLLLLLLGMCTGIVFTLVEILELKLQLDLQQTSNTQAVSEIKANLSHVYTQLMQITTDKRADQYCRVADCAAIKQTLRTNTDSLNELLVQHQYVNTLENLGQPSSPAASCASLLAFSPTTPSGYYWVRASNGSAVRVYCDMTRSCGGVTGGWTRVAELDITDATAGDFKLLINSPPACGIRMLS
jgi:hypothetical protein